MTTLHRTLAPWLARPWTTPLVLALVVAVLHGRAAGFAFTSWDDTLFLQANEHLHGFSWAHWRQVWVLHPLPEERLYVPLIYLSYWVELSLAHGQPWLTHLDNVLLHLLAGCLLARLLAQLGASLLASLLGALLFVVHPTQVETVAWMVGRKDLLATVLALATLLVWQRARQPGQRGAYGLMLLLATLAMLAKPTMVVLPGIMWLLASYADGRWSWPAAWRLAPVAGLSVVVYAVNRLVDHGGGAPPPLSLGWRLVALPWAAGQWWLRLLLQRWPEPWYVWPTPDDATELLLTAAVTLLVAGGLLLLAWRRRAPWLALGLGWWALGLLPAALLILRDARQFVTADHYGYFAMAGPAWLLASGVTRATGRLRPWLLAAVPLALLAMAALTVRQMGVWQDSGHLWSEVLRQHPTQPHALNSYGEVLAAQGQDQEAMAHFQLATQYAPGYWEAWTNQGVMLLRYGKLADALACFDRATPGHPDDPDLRQNRGLVLAHLGRWAEAREDFTAAARLRPAWTAPYVALADVCERTNDRDGEVAAWQAVVSRQPANRDAWRQLGGVLLQLGRWDDALAALAQAPPDGKTLVLQAAAKAHMLPPSAVPTSIYQFGP